MRYPRIRALLLGVLTIALPLFIFAEDNHKVTTVKLDEPSWQAVLDRLFGTPGNGLLDGTNTFDFRAEDVKLTVDQSNAFFSSSDLPITLADMIAAAEMSRSQIRMEGTVDGFPFELKFAGRELKLEGITLTAAQRDALLADLRGISGLREAKIDAFVDGVETRIHLAGGKERIQVLGRGKPEAGLVEKEKLDRGRDKSGERPKVDKPRIEKPGLSGIESPGRGLGRIERLERPGRGK